MQYIGFVGLFVNQSRHQKAPKPGATLQFQSASMLVQIQKQTDVMSNGGEDDELDRSTYAQLLLDK